MHFLGSLKGGDVSALLSQADVFCLPLAPKDSALRSLKPRRGVVRP